MDDPARLGAQAASLGVALEPDQAERLIAFEGLLLERAIPAGLVARSDSTRVRERHVLDCLRAAPLVANGAQCYDLGSGAGLPGVVVAIARLEIQVGLVDSRSRRAAFLELVVQELGLINATVLPVRLEDLEEPVDLCFARALAPLPQAWKAARPLLRASGRLVYFGGSALDPAEIPDDAVVEDVLVSPVLESAGSLVIMARQ